ncbi:hypothetical protein ABKV19_010152 [Rosa sericea]
MFSILLLCLCLKTHDISLAADTITANQSLSGDQTIVSEDGVFELGFFKPGNNSNYYIGMWYYKTIVPEKTIVWVANREQPVSDRFSSVLTMSDGNLVLFNESKSPVWSTNLSSTTLGSVKAVLLDDGNLVLRAGSSSSHPLWQSFDHPAHTWLPGSKLGFNNFTKQTQMLTSWKNAENPAPGLFSLQLDPNGSNSLVILLNRSRQYWSSGSWDDSLHTFSLSPEMSPNNIFNYSHATNENESYFTYSVYYPNEVSRLVMYFSGQVWQLTWKTNQWNLVWSKPNIYAYCGAFSTYSQNQSESLRFCTCLSGFAPKSQSEWDLQDYSGGCSRNTLNCGNGTKEDQFKPMASMPLSASQQLQQVGSIEDCESNCLRKCDCSAYGYGYTTGCYIWTGDLLADDNGRTLYIRVPAAESKNPSFKRSLVIALVSGITGLLTIICSYFLWKKTTRKRRKRQRKHGEIISNVGGKNDTELPVFDLKSILAATEDFSAANKLGEGGFGPVYKGILPGNRKVAIKMLSKKSGQGHLEFMNELKLIAKLQHTNLVRLLGCCIEEEERMLIYEYMPNRSLDKFLFGMYACQL